MSKVEQDSETPKDLDVHMTDIVEEVNNDNVLNNEANNIVTEEIKKTGEMTLKGENSDNDGKKVTDVTKTNDVEMSNSNLDMKDDNKCNVKVKSENLNDVSTLSKDDDKAIDYEFVNVQYENLFNPEKLKEERDLLTEENTEISEAQKQDAVLRYKAAMTSATSNVGSLKGRVADKEATNVMKVLDTMKPQEIVAGFNHLQQETHNKVAESVSSLRDILGEYNERQKTVQPAVTETPREETIEETIERARRLLDRVDLTDPTLPGGTEKLAQIETIADKMRRLEGKIEDIIKKNNQPIL